MKFKKLNSIKTSALLVMLLVINLGTYAQNDLGKVPDISMVYAPAKLKGEIKGVNFQNDKNPSLKIIITDPVTFFSEYDIPIQIDGTFEFQTKSFGLATAIINSPCLNASVLLYPEEETRLVIDKNAPQNSIYTDGKSSLDFNDINNMSEILSSSLRFLQENNEFEPIDNLIDYIGISKNYIQICEDYIDKNNSISQDAKTILKYAIRPFIFRLRHLNYYDQALADRKKPLFFFMESFSAEDAAYFYSSYYHEFMRYLLNNKSISNLLLEQSNIEKWMQEAKSTLGYTFKDNGYFYELLITNTFIEQIRQGKLLTQTQITDIEHYFQNTPYKDILFDENKRVKTLLSENQQLNSLKIMTTPEVANESLLQTIISNHSGKVVLLDFWATWCAPCLSAMDETADFKIEMVDQNIDFIYITNPSSPLGLWHNKINRIGGYHYYLTREQWEYILDQHEFSGIPTYFFYDSTGKLQRKQTGFAGVDKFRQWISEISKL